MHVRSGLLLALLLGALPALPASILYGVTDLGLDTAFGINNAGQVVGSSGGHAFLYTNGLRTDLGLGTASGINNVGQVVGYSLTSGNDYNSRRAFLYRNGQMTDLGTLLEGGIASAGASTRRGRS